MGAGRGVTYALGPGGEVNPEEGKPARGPRAALSPEGRLEGRLSCMP